MKSRSSNSNTTTTGDKEFFGTMIDALDPNDPVRTVSYLNPDTTLVCPKCTHPCWLSDGDEYHRRIAEHTSSAFACNWCGEWSVINNGTIVLISNHDLRAQIEVRAPKDFVAALEAKRSSYTGQISGEAAALGINFNSINNSILK